MGERKGLTVPHAHAAVASPTRERVTPELHAPDKVLVHLPAPIGVRGRRRRGAEPATLAPERASEPLARGRRRRGVGRVRVLVDLVRI